MDSKRLNRDEMNRAWEHAQSLVAGWVKEGSCDREKAKKILDSARDNYRNANYNRELDKIEKKYNA